MSTPSVPPIPSKGGEPDKTVPSSHRKVERVEKVDETDSESRAREKFQKQLIKTKGKTKDKTVPLTSQAPSPFTLFSMPRDSGMDKAAETALSSPAYSPSPSAVLNGSVATEKESEASLPNSPQFWKNVDEPSDSLVATPQMEETPLSASRTFVSQDKEMKEESSSSGPQKSTSQSDNTEETTEEKKRNAQTKRKKEQREFIPSFFGPPGKPILQEKEETPATLTPEEQAAYLKKELLGPEGVIDGPFIKYVGSLPQKKKHPSSLEGEEARLTPFARGQLPLASFPKEEQILSSPPSPNEEKTLPPSPQVKSIHKEEKLLDLPVSSTQSQTIERKEKKEDKKKEESAETPLPSIELPTTMPLPASVMPMATAAATAAAPYLGREALSLYMYMVGTIVSMVSPSGDSHMEFVLNAPSFANSKFYGSTISIDRFSTAPYQLNIRLTGSNTAVQLFNQNIPNLLAAFQNERFSFTINRIEAIYERPLIRRKERTKEKGDRS